MFGQEGCFSLAGNWGNAYGVGDTAGHGSIAYNPPVQTAICDTLPTGKVSHATNVQWRVQR